ncbi:hypothetical protein BDV98DRAFT_575648 [Pterulicium gracile]|uniref:Uncharacterized protein n=1 Tax=Pterulicium gracile TaxID=1884261 RepID=A0A5C3Q9D8_9AGAR|nr:hypothetical protein BDV98DRAFT_575648 [Pterula gracilis]
MPILAQSSFLKHVQAVRGAGMSRVLLMCPILWQQALSRNACLIQGRPYYGSQDRNEASTPCGDTQRIGGTSTKGVSVACPGSQTSRAIRYAGSPLPCLHHGVLPSGSDAISLHR